MTMGVRVYLGGFPPTSPFMDISLEQFWHLQYHHGVKFREEPISAAIRKAKYKIWQQNQNQTESIETPDVDRAHTSFDQE